MIPWKKTDKTNYWLSKHLENKFMWVVFTTTSAWVSLVTQDFTTVFTAVNVSTPPLKCAIKSGIISHKSVCLFQVMHNPRKTNICAVASADEIDEASGIMSCANHVSNNFPTFTTSKYSSPFSNYSSGWALLHFLLLKWRCSSEHCFDEKLEYIQYLVLALVTLHTIPVDPDRGAVWKGGWSHD